MDGAEPLPVVERYERDGLVFTLHKGGGKGGGGQTTTYTPREDPNTLRSRARVRLLEVLSEGPIAGFTDPVNWGKDVFLDQTPMQSADGTWNFPVLEAHSRYGYPDQDPIPGFPIAEAEFDVGAELKQGAPVIRTVSNDLSAVRVRMRLQSLFLQQLSGDVVGHYVRWAIYYRVNGGAWVAAWDETISGKTMSPYERQVRVNLPAGPGPFDIRVDRISADDPEPRYNSDTYFAGYTEVIDGAINYADTAVFAVGLDSQSIPNVPRRGYRIWGIICDVPSNYDPIARTYAGDWDGTFKAAWTNNTAWVLWDLIANRRYGLGEDLRGALPDKWSFYEAARRCDEMVNDGKGGLEPRYAFNGVINVQKPAFDVLNAVAASMDCLLYYSQGTIALVQDRPAADIERYITNGDVVDGLFDYMGADITTRWTSVIVQWVDPDDMFNPAPAYVIDPTLLTRQGKRETTLALMGCTSRGQAIRAGRRLIYMNQYETEAMTFRAPIALADLRPGMVIAISDMNRVGARYGGRIVNWNNSATAWLDAMPAEMEVGWTIVFQAGPTPYIRTITIADHANSRVSLGGGFMPDLQIGDTWIAIPANVKPTEWRIIAVGEREKFEYEFTCVAYDKNKWSYVDEGVRIEPPPHSLIPTGDIKPPTSPVVREFIYLDSGGNPQAGATMSWAASPDARVMFYNVEVRDVNNNLEARFAGSIAALWVELMPLRQSNYRLTVAASDALGRKSTALVHEFTTIGLSEKPVPPLSFFAVPSGPQVFLSWVPSGEVDIKYWWLKYTPDVDASATWDRASTLLANVSRTTVQAYVPGRAGTYFIKPVDSLGQQADVALQARIVSNIWERNVIATLEPAPTWTGAPAPFVVESGVLKLPPPAAPEPVPPEIWPGTRDLINSGTPTRYAVYDFPTVIDTGQAGILSAMTMPVAWGTLGVTTMAEWIPLASAVPLAGAVSSNWEAHISLAKSADGVTYEPWQPVLSGDESTRYVKARLIVLIYDLATTVNIESGLVLVDVVDRIERAQGVNVTNNQVITFTPPFHAVPSVTITEHDTNTDSRVFLKAVTANSFTIAVLNGAGAPTTSRIDWQAIGY